MSPKIGRPKANNPKSCDIKVRIDSSTHERLLAYCDEEKLTKAEAIRQGINLLLDKK